MVKGPFVPDGQITEQTDGNKYKYWGILEGASITHNEMKEKVR